MKLLKKIYHILIKRDVVTSLYTRNFKYFGKNSLLYKPKIIRKKEDISIGDNTTILNMIRIQTYNDITGLKAKVIIGNNCFIGYNNSFLAGENIVIDDGVLMASNILISSENHSINPEVNEYYMDQPLICKPVHIGEGTWIGERVCVMPGVNIGKKCIIGAGSIVTKSIPNYSMAVGSPAKIVKRYNFSTHSWEKVVE
jgi:acetyltransferase-like isoleucine patch superfamily enzyme